MDNVLFIDIETRSLVDLKDSGAWVYAENESTDILCLAYSNLKGTVKVWFPGDPVPGVFKTHKGVYAAHYALFDYAITANILVKRYGWPKRLTNFKHWYCTRALSVSAGLPGSLEAAGRIISGGTEKKLKTGSGLINKYSKPQKDRKTGERYFNTLQGEDRQLMIAYNKQDITVSREIYKKTIDLPNVELERPIFLLDFKQNLQGLPIDIKNVYAIQDVLKAATEKAEREMERIGVNVRSGKQMIPFLASHGIQVDNIQAATIEEIIRTSKNKKVLKVCELRQFLGKASIKKYKALENRYCKDGTLKYFLLYYGAHTGRFSGQGFQPHNLPKMNVDEKQVNAAIKDLKKETNNYSQIVHNAKVALPGMIKAEKGKVFLMGDFSAIEARGIAYLANEFDLLQQFARGEDVYKNMAAILFNKKVSSITKDERQLGKTIILGCGYGMGIDKFYSVCHGYGMGISKELAERSVYTYRTTYHNIKSFWYELSDGFIYTYKTGKPTNINDKVLIEKINKYIRIKLPSGRYLYYHNVAFDREGNITYWNFLQNARVKLWGGILAENVTQALCRDILADRMIEADKRKLNPLLQVHDEVVCYVDRKRIGETSNIFLNIMNTTPKWLPGFPLKTEIEITGRYHK